jgi:putative peptidoglycan lipid II flippase
MSSLRAAILVAFFSILSKVLGLVKQMVFAHALGAGREVDIYVAAFRVPDLLFNLLILGTLSVAFIPVFVEHLEKNREEASLVASSIFNFTLLVMAALGGLGFLAAPWFVKVLVPGFDALAKRETIELTRILMLSPLLFSLSSVLTSVLHSFKRFLLASFAPLLYNLSLIGGIVFFYPVYGLKGIVWAAVFGAFLHFLIQLPSVLGLGLRIFRDFAWRHEAVKKIGKLFLPRIFGIDLGQISLLVTSVIGSALGAGSLAIIYYSYDLNTVPLGIFALSFAIASFPNLASYFAKKDFSTFKSFLAKTMTQVLFIIIPVSVLMLLLRAQLVRLVYGAGQGTAFSFADTRLTAQALGFFVLSLFAQSLVPLLARAFYAMQNTVIPVISGLAATVINIVLAIVFTHFGRADTMALAFSIAIVFHMLIMFVVLRRRLGGIEDEFLLVRIIKISVASVVMAIATFLTMYLVAPLVNMQTYFGILFQTLAAAAVAAITYLMAGFAIKLPETRDLLGIAKAWFTKYTRSLAASIVNMFE